jgi:DNA-nicking Smr family endonuclease
MKLRPKSQNTSRIKSTDWSFTPFQGLREAVNKKNLALARQAPSPLSTKTDEEMFRDAMADVREIKEFRKIPLKLSRRVRNIPLQKDDSLEILHQILSGEKKIRIADTGEYIEWTSPDLRKDLTRKLHEGNFSVQDSIDLHGMNLHMAEEAFIGFLGEALKRRLFCVKVIHGRGLRSPKGPVLKEALKKWLQGSFRKSILAYSTAQDCDGGLGATYILLKTK